MPAVASELLEALETIAAKRPRVLVWGDRCTDLYRFCKPHNGRLVLVGEDEYAGMAGAVANACEAIGANTKHVTYGTATHERIIVDGRVAQWIERQGWSEWDSQWNVEREIAAFNPQAILIADYGRGMCWPEKLRTVIDAANAAGVPVVVDPHRNSDWQRYRGATVIKCNAGTYTNAGQPGVGRANNFAGGDTCAIVETCSEQSTLGPGCVIYSPGQTTKHVRSEFPMSYPLDSTGCGDLMTAAIGCCLAVGIDLPTACRLGNIAAGIKCGHWGPRPTPAEEIRAAVG